MLFHKYAPLLLVVGCLMSGCASDAIPSPKDRLSAIESGEVTLEEAEEKGWMDEAFTKYYQSAHPFALKVPAAATSYAFPALGLTLSFSEDWSIAQQNGEIWMYYAASDDGTNACVYFQEGTPPKDLLSMTDYEDWLATSTPIGAIGFAPAGQEGIALPYIETMYTSAPTLAGQTTDNSQVCYVYANPDSAYADLFAKRTILFETPTQHDQTAAFGYLDSPHLVTDLGDFPAQSLQGQWYNGNLFAQADLTMVNVWATFCGYCIDEMPALEEISQEMQQKGASFQIVGICMDVTPEGPVDEAQLNKALAIEEATGVTYVSLIPDETMLQGPVGTIQNLPTTFFVDRQGHITGQAYAGANDKESWQEIIDAHLSLVEGAE